MLPDRLEAWDAPIQDEGRLGPTTPRQPGSGSLSWVERLFEGTGPVLSWLAGILGIMTVGAQIYIALNR
mgnify:CR=1 FL=1